MSSNNYHRINTCPRSRIYLIKLYISVYASSICGGIGTCSRIFSQAGPNFDACQDITGQDAAKSVHVGDFQASLPKASWPVRLGAWPRPDSQSVRPDHAHYAPVSVQYNATCLSFWRHLSCKASWRNLLRCIQR